MAGTPSSLGCDACRKKKKGCDQEKPKCGRCKRLKIECVGGGSKRWMFKSYRGANAKPNPSPQKSPSNEKTRLASALVNILGIQDIRYDIRTFGSTLIPGLTCQIGANPALDACIAAMVALYRTRQYNESRVDALAKYGDALRAVMICVQDPAEKYQMRMQTVAVISICEVKKSEFPGILIERKLIQSVIIYQRWVDWNSAAQHHRIMTQLFRDAVLQGRLGEIVPDYIYGLLEMMVYSSWVDPEFELGQWFWDVCATITSPRPIRCHKGSPFISLEVGRLADLTSYLKAPKRNLYQIQRAYDVLLSEKPRLHQLLALSTLSTLSPNVTLIAIKLCANYRYAYGLMLGIALVLNYFIRIFDHDPGLMLDTRGFVDESILLVQQSASQRPYGATFAAEFLKVVLALTPDSYRSTELEAMLIDYQTNDYEHATFTLEAVHLRNRLERTAMAQTRDEMSQETSVNSQKDGTLSPHDISECVVM